MIQKEDVIIGISTGGNYHYVKAESRRKQLSAYCIQALWFTQEGAHRVLIMISLPESNSFHKIK